MSYVKNKDFLIPKGLSKESVARLKSNEAFTSVIDKVNIIQLANKFPANEKDYAKDERFKPKTAHDLCIASENMGQVQYELDDFRYCKWFGLPINRLITLRRFPFPCTDNIYDKFNQAEPDIARMVTYTNNDTNKLEDVLSFGYRMKWEERTAEMEPMNGMQGDQSGFSGIAGKLMKYMDPAVASNKLAGDNALQYDPKHDGNKTYGPVDSLTRTHLRGVGLEFDKKFDLVFEYEMKSYDARSPEMVMRDIIANVLGVTYNNAKFWPGARYWVGERPSSYLKHFKGMRRGEELDKYLEGAYQDLKGAVGDFIKKHGKGKGGAIEALKTAMKNGIMMSVGKLLDTIGRPSIPMMNSLLSGEPVGYWHVMIGNPYNPQMCIGNLIIDDVQFKFPTETLSYGDFPNKLEVTISLKPAMDKDKAGVEMMFNMGKQRIYHQPNTVKVAKNKQNINRTSRAFEGNDKSVIGKAYETAIDFAAEKTVNVVVDTYELAKKGIKSAFDSRDNSDRLAQNKTDKIKKNTII